MTLSGAWFVDGQGWVKVPHQDGGRKTGLRAYFLSRGDGAIFLCEEMIMYVHGVPHDPRSTDHSVQSIHGTQINSGRDNFLFSTWDDKESLRQIVHNCMECGRALCPVWHGVMADHQTPLCDTGAAGDVDGDRRHCHMLYHFWGVDFMASMDNSVQLLEMNVSLPTYLSVEMIYLSGVALFILCCKHCAAAFKSNQAWCNLNHETPGEVALHGESPGLHVYMQSVWNSFAISNHA